MAQIMTAKEIAAPWRHQRVTGRLARLTATTLKPRPSADVSATP